MSNINFVTTDAGIASTINSSGVAVTIKNIAFGTGNYTPEASRTSLENQIISVDIRSGRIKQNTLLIEGILDHDQSFNINEIGIFLDDGTLFAVYSHATKTTAVKSESIDIQFIYALNIGSINSNAITISTTGFGESDLQDIRDTITSLEVTVNSLTTGTGVGASDLQDIRDTITRLEVTVNTLTTSVGSMSWTDLNDIRDAIARLEVTVNTLTTSVGSMSWTDLNDIRDTITRLEGTVNTLTTNISSISWNDLNDKPTDLVSQSDLNNAISNIHSVNIELRFINSGTEVAKFRILGTLQADSDDYLNIIIKDASNVEIKTVTITDQNTINGFEFVYIGGLSSSTNYNAIIQFIRKSGGETEKLAENITPFSTSNTTPVEFNLGSYSNTVDANTTGFKIFQVGTINIPASMTLTSINLVGTNADDVNDYIMWINLGVITVYNGPLYDFVSGTGTDLVTDSLIPANPSCPITFGVRGSWDSTSGSQVHRSSISIVSMKLTFEGV